MGNSFSEQIRWFFFLVNEEFSGSKMNLLANLRGFSWPEKHSSFNRRNLVPSERLLSVGTSLEGTLFCRKGMISLSGPYLNVSYIIDLRRLDLCYWMVVVGPSCRSLNLEYR